METIPKSLTIHNANAKKKCSSSYVAARILSGGETDRQTLSYSCKHKNFEWGKETDRRTLWVKLSG